MTADQVSEIAAAGGRLIVTPHADAAVVRAAKRHGLFAVPGFFTPAEAFSMLNAGADALKLFPAEGASPAMLRAMRAVLPAGTMVLPVGGIDASNMAGAGWRHAALAGFGIGSAIYKPGDTPAAVTAKARALTSSLTHAEVFTLLVRRFQTHLIFVIPVSYQECHQRFGATL